VARLREATEPEGALVPFSPGRLWTCWRPLRFFGVAIGTRMTVCRFASGALWVHSPVAIDAQLTAALRGLGPVRWVVAPSRLHHLALLDFARAFPEAALYASALLPPRRPDVCFAGVLGDEPESA